MGASVPKYMAVVNWVRENIENGTFQFGERLMSENELCEKFGLSRQTIRHATGVLEEERLVTRVRGSGTYIGSAYQPARKTQYKNIAVVSTFYENYIFPAILRGIAKVLNKAGYSTQVSFTDNRFEAEREILLNLLEKDNVDGVIFEPSQSSLPNPNIELYRELQNRHIPILCFNTYYQDLKVPYVSLDDVSVAYKATKLLIDAGHNKRIGCIFKSDDGQGKLRYEGYLKALSEAGMTIHSEHIIWMDTYLQQHMKENGNYFLERLAQCSAVVCYNDDVAVKLINIFTEHGLLVPEDMSVVGIDDASLAVTGNVPLTTFPHPKEMLGEKVANNMLGMIEDPRFDGNYLFDVDVIERGSVKKNSMG